MKYKEFREIVNQDSSLLKLKAKDLADIFGIEKYQAKYFKEKYKDDLSYVPMEGFKETEENKPSKQYKQTTTKPISSAFGNIIEVDCTCPICNENIILDCFNSGGTLVECPECVTLLYLKDNVVERYNGEQPKQENVLEYLLNEIEKLKQ